LSVLLQRYPEVPARHTSKEEVMKVIAVQIVFVLGVTVPFFYWGLKAYHTPPHVVEVVGVGEMLSDNLQTTANNCLLGNRKACEEVGRQAGNTK